jgi:hypothetical protein
MPIFSLQFSLTHSNQYAVQRQKMHSLMHVHLAGKVNWDDLHPLETELAQKSELGMWHSFALLLGSCFSSNRLYFVLIFSQASTSEA